MKRDFIIFSIGNNCRPAYYLQYHNIRTEAYPMDWQVCDLDNTLLLYKMGFKDFFKYYKEFPKRENKKRGLRYVKDTKYGIVAMHHIKTDLPLDEGVSNFVKLMLKRYRRLDKGIKQSSKVIMVSRNNVSFCRLEQFLNEFSNIYKGKEMILVNVHSRKNGNKMHAHQLDSKHKIIEFFFNDVYSGEEPERHGWRGNEEKWNEVMQYIIENIC